MKTSGNFPVRYSTFTEKPLGDWVANDLMSLKIPIDLDVFFKRFSNDQGEALFSAFLESHRSIRPFNEIELYIIPHLKLGFWLFYSCFHTRHDQFYSFLQNSALKSRVSIIKHQVENFS